jgi:hypothetical protein
MEDLVKKIIEKTGITPEQAKTTIETIVDYVKEKIPPMFHGQIDKIMKSAKEKSDDII